MNILVCISSVPDTTSPINFTDNNKNFDTTGITFIINPYAEFCLTKAIFIKESIGANITVINVGDSQNEPVLRKALAIGADKAIRINSKPTDSYSTANEIAHYLKNNVFANTAGSAASQVVSGSWVAGAVVDPLLWACSLCPIIAKSTTNIADESARTAPYHTNHRG